MSRLQSRSALVFFPHNIWPPLTGAHKRCLAVLEAMNELGFAVTFASSTHSSETPWSPLSIDEAESGVVSKVVLINPSRFDKRFVRRVRQLLERVGRDPAIDSIVYSPPDMRIKFRNLINNLRPDVLLMNYAHWDGLLPPHRNGPCRYVVDALDLLTITEAMRTQLAKVLPRPPIRPQEVNPRIFSPEYLHDLMLVKPTKEFRIYDRYDHTIAISPWQARQVCAHTSRTNVSLIPVSVPTSESENDYSGSAWFPTGPNHFNVQGYLHFVRNILPEVQRTSPSFCVDVTGWVSERVVPQDGVRMQTFAAKFSDLARHARFVISPVLVTTGQQIKIVEAMAHGLPVVAFRTAADGAPIQHGFNGFLADDASDFARYSAALWEDQGLCRRMGQAAKKAVAMTSSIDHLTEALAPVVL